jgi:ADP-ribose pyrophosphatase YjhB (NUDIX family)
VSLADDLRAEGEPEPEFHPGIAARLPRKRVAAGALIRDGHGRVLFVVPGYKPVLDIPGGVAEENESPFDACLREIQEELGIEVSLYRLLVVDWVPAHGVWSDALLFVYDGGVLTDAQVARLDARDPELVGIQLLTLDQAAPSLRPSMHRRLRAAIAALTAIGDPYAEFGRMRSE